MAQETSPNQTVSTSINSSQMNVAGNGNLNLGNQVINNFQQADTKPVFHPIRLDSYDIEHYPSPLMTETLLSRVSNRRIILLGGNYGFDKEGLARHMAYLLHEQNPHLVVKEWIYTSDFQTYNVFSSLRKEKDAGIFVIPQVSARDVSFDLPKLAEVAEEGNHYIILSTNWPLGSWKLPPDQLEEYWYEVPDTKLFSDETLSAFLVKQLNLQIKLLSPISQRLEEWRAETLICDGKKAKDIASSLKNLDQVTLFAKIYSQQSTIPTQQKVLEIMDLTNRQDKLLQRWFQTLSPKGKIIALGVSLFDGLYDGQFFEAFKLLIRDAKWHKHDGLELLDYFDLDEILNFFKLESIDNIRRTLQGKFPSQRRELLKIAWDSHQRHIINALPVLTGLVVNSVIGTDKNWELFGTQERRETLRNVISETISDLGLISLPLTENTLLSLASTNNQTIQIVAARAMARWRGLGQDDLLFETLEKWQYDTQFAAIIERILGNNTYHNSIRAALVLTLGYATDFDQPNQLSPKIIELLKQLIFDTDEQIRDRMINLVLPKTIGNHLLQIRPTVWEWIKDSSLYDRYFFPFSTGIADAYRSYPEHVELLLSEWTAECEQNIALRSKSGEKMTWRDKGLWVIIQAYAQIEYYENPWLNRQQAYLKIKKLQETERHISNLRAAYLDVVLTQIEIDFKNAWQDLPILLDNLSVSEKRRVVEQFFSLYLTERKKPVGAKYSLPLTDGSKIPIFVDVKRNLTDIETSLSGWLKHSNPDARQIAILAFSEMARRIETEEMKLIEEIKELEKEEEKRKNETPVSIPEPPTRLIEANLNTRIVLGLTNPSSFPNEVQLIKSALPVLLQDSLVQKKHIETLLDKWSELDDRAFQSVTDYIKPLLPWLSIIRNLKTIILGLSIFLLFWLVPILLKNAIISEEVVVLGILVICSIVLISWLVKNQKKN